jgi:cytidylate kinase
MSSSEPGAELEAPRHGMRGKAQGRLPKVPAALTIAVSREAGSRGGTIARRVGRKLGWQVYNQELLDYIAQEGAFTEGVLANLPGDAARWSEEHLQDLLRDKQLSAHPSVLDLARIVLALAAQGEAVLLGRGAGYILPRATTLHIRIIAPLEDRIAYMSQWLRLTMEEAAEQVRLRDRNRGEFLGVHFHRQPSDVYQYDLLLNSSLLGEELCVDLIAQAARAKLAGLEQGSDSPVWEPETAE